MRDFNERIDRRNTQATKWDRYQKDFGEERYPLWLADMDFPVSEAIQKALMKRVEHPIYGYTDRTERDYRIFAERFQKAHEYEIETEDVILSTGVMYSLAAAIQLFTDQEDGILLPTPAYPPFFKAVSGMQRTLLCVPMKVEEGIYTMDFEKMESVIDEKTKAIILCNPHNPTGRIFTVTELTELACFCERHRLLIFSDEIHCDFVYQPSAFFPIMKVNAYTREHTVAMVAPTKTFNLAGLKISAVFIKNKEMNEKFRQYASLIGISSINLLALEACRAAYSYSQEWERELRNYLTGNRDFVFTFIREQLPKVGICKPEGTYFYWLDFGTSGIAPELIHKELMESGHVILNEGTTFAMEYMGFERLNMALPRPMLEKALMQIKAVTEKGAVK